MNRGTKEQTTIWANCHDLNPNKELIEINVSEACFYPNQHLPEPFEHIEQGSIPLKSRKKIYQMPQISKISIHGYSVRTHIHKWFCQEQYIYTL